MVVAGAMGITNKHTAMKHKKVKKLKVVNWDAIKAMRRGEREAQHELLGPGFHATTRPHRSKKTYTRKAKHKSQATDE